MSRPLELVVYPHVRWQPEPGVIVPHPSFYEMPDGGLVHITEVYDTAKRLTDAELAAEYQFSRLDSRVRMARVENYSGDKVLFDHYERGLDQEATLERFATHPHYDEEPTDD